MPTYEYECKKCRRTFEYEQKISDPPLTRCTFGDSLIFSDAKLAGSQVPTRLLSVPCDGEVRRVIAGQTGFVLNGKGWFRDGY